MLNNCITEKNKTTQTYIIKHIYKVVKQEIYVINLIKIKHYQRCLLAILHFKRYIILKTNGLNINTFQCNNNLIT